MTPINRLKDLLWEAYARGRAGHTDDEFIEWLYLILKKESVLP